MFSHLFPIPLLLVLLVLTPLLDLPPPSLLTQLSILLLLLTVSFAPRLPCPDLDALLLSELLDSGLDLVRYPLDEGPEPSLLLDLVGPLRALCLSRFLGLVLRPHQFPPGPQVLEGAYVLDLQLIQQ